jgi:hypothetical protein
VPALAQASKSAVLVLVSKLAAAVRERAQEPAGRERASKSAVVGLAVVGLAVAGPAAAAQAVAEQAVAVAQAVAEPAAAVAPVEVAVAALVEAEPAARKPGLGPQAGLAAGWKEAPIPLDHVSRRSNNQPGRSVALDLSCRGPGSRT